MHTCTMQLTQCKKIRAIVHFTYLQLQADSVIHTHSSKLKHTGSKCLTNSVVNQHFHYKMATRSGLGTRLCQVCSGSLYDATSGTMRENAEWAICWNYSK